jgi:hypothetical protein
MIDFLRANLSEHFFVAILIVSAFIWGIYRLARLVIETRKAAKDFIAHVVDERVPAVIKAALSNGISEMIVRLNAEQDRRWSEAMQQAFRDHEKREDDTYRRERRRRRDR